MLHELLTSKRDEIIARTRMKVAVSAVPRATEVELVHGVPLFLDQLVEALQDSAPANDEVSATATRHGKEMLQLGFTAAEVVYAYGNVCQTVTGLAVELESPITLGEFHTMSRCLHDAIAGAVTEHARLYEQTVSEQRTGRLDDLADEMHSQLGAAILSLGLLKDGENSLGTTIGTLVDRSLLTLNDLIDRAQTEMRMESLLHPSEPIEAPRPVEKKPVILVVDRDPHVRELQSHFLQQAGYAVELEQDGEGALDRARKVVPDLIITEILVPPLDGLSLCRRLKSDPRTRDVAVLVFSILASAGRARDAGADAFLLKPLAEHTLVGTVGQLLEARNARIGRTHHERWS